jgi:hypothetical protein
MDFRKLKQYLPDKVNSETPNWFDSSGTCDGGMNEHFYQDGVGSVIFNK